jgi:putative ABC transport system permease protein
MISLQAFSYTHLKRSLLLGLKSLWLHRLRSLLTALGIVFGVASVIAMLAIGEGASETAQDEIRLMGSQDIIVSSVKPTSTESTQGGSQRSRISQYGITYRDISQIQSTIPGVEIVVPDRTIKQFAWHRTHSVEAAVIGSVPSYPMMRGRAVVRGRFFSPIEARHNANVCTLSQDAARTLFPFHEPVGNSIRIGGTYFQVVGIIEPRRSTADPNAEADEASAKKNSGTPEIFIPIGTMRERFGEVDVRSDAGSFQVEKVEFHHITVRVTDPDEVVATANAVRHILAINHRQGDYEVLVPMELLRQAERTRQIFNVVLGSIAAISLVVGGIGIMNIMLASVTERTREIGIRRALGARRPDIILQFLIETVLLSGLGGVIGVMLGLAIPLLVTELAGMQTTVRLWAPTVAFSISVLIGIVFGIYPALRAARMNPVEALRHQ